VAMEENTRPISGDVSLPSKVDTDSKDIVLIFAKVSYIDLSSSSSLIIFFSNMCIRE